MCSVLSVFQVPGTLLFDESSPIKDGVAFENLGRHRRATTTVGRSVGRLVGWLFSSFFFVASRTLGEDGVSSSSSSSVCETKRFREKDEDDVVDDVDADAQWIANRERRCENHHHSVS